jgi:hypothetical protein
VTTTYDIIAENEAIVSKLVMQYNHTNGSSAEDVVLHKSDTSRNKICFSLIKLKNRIAPCSSNIESGNNFAKNALRLESILHSDSLDFFTTVLTATKLPKVKNEITTIVIVRVANIAALVCDKGEILLSA